MEKPLGSSAGPFITLPWLTRGERRIPETTRVQTVDRPNHPGPEPFRDLLRGQWGIGSDMPFASPAGGPMRLHAHPRVRRYLGWRSDIMTLVRRIVSPVQGLVLLRSGPRERAAQGLNRFSGYLFFDV
ncbi:hypothetical protein N7510_004445 [Penicillium lagena]|uniref:uncharacterized protein n=1 Tax=Penicillium lagena TaxID=94218 RepID=UPI0025406F3B|nr:uncharacterized protein N7510_004445 [Penicillium lagena]KAJ5620461.1 hypothetical protein N7510_004445 [Penicillium lagena]